MTPDVSTKIKVQVTVEVTVSSAWGSDWRVANVVKEAREIGIHSLRVVLTEGRKPHGVSFDIVGEPRILALLVPVEPR